MGHTSVFGSFRDPAGFIFLQGNQIYRQVNKIYAPHYDHLMGSGLYEELVKQQLLIPHQELPDHSQAQLAYKTIRPEPISMVSYPYEWCFSQLKDAALLTLKINKLALEYGMILKDASAFNVQFAGYRPVFIDTLSFEKYDAGQPWVAYRQYLQHFLAPLALAAYVDVRLLALTRLYIDGLPLGLVKKLLPASLAFRPTLAAHLFLNAAWENSSVNGVARASARAKMDKNKIIVLLDNLEALTRSLTWRPPKTVWSDYYQNNNYSTAAFQNKLNLVDDYVSATGAQSVWDLGSNSGVFSRLASSRGIYTVSFDIDPVAVEFNYQTGRNNKETNLLPLILDLFNPSPDLGWAHAERRSLASRGPVDLIMALALVHHLRIANNLPFNEVADFFSKLGQWLIVEFVPKQDSQVKKLLQFKKDIYPDYSQADFEKVFKSFFEIVKKTELPESARTLYLMRKK